MTETEHRVATGSTSAITPDDPRYASLVRGTNHRFVGRPDYVRVAATTEQVAEAVAEAVSAGRRISVRSGGHCFEDFTVARPGGILLDMSEMTKVYFDKSMRAFAVEPGATLGHVYRVLFKGWNVTIPGGECTEVCAGGHFAGGGYGPLSRSLGAVVDYVCAVEVVVADLAGTVRTVVATADADDPHRDLWWAHTGGGGGNFGVVTRYWMRSPGATSADPGELLPRAPSRWRIGRLTWTWDDMSERDFTTLLRDFGTWFERHSAPDSPFAALSGFFVGSHRPGYGYGLAIGATVDDEVPGAAALMNEYFETVSAGVGATAVRDEVVGPWLYYAAYPNWGDPGTPDVRRIKIKSAYLRKGYTDAQIDTVYRHLTSDEESPCQLILLGYGGQVNTVAPEATATAQRDSIMKAAYMSLWADESEDDVHIHKLRTFFRDVYAATGGVPVPDERNDGAYINYPDADLADLAWNTSGVPWSTLYYKDNYPRLQAVKQRYDPGDVFRHSLSIALPDTAGRAAR